MSLDLTLLPYYSFDTGDEADILEFSLTILPLKTNTRDLMEELMEASWNERPNSVSFVLDKCAPTGNVADSFTCHLTKDVEGEYCYGKTNKDAYGEQMRWMRVEELLKFKDHPQVINNIINKAAWGYLENLPINTRVALYWS